MQMFSDDLQYGVEMREMTPEQILWDTIDKENLIEKVPIEIAMIFNFNREIFNVTIKAIENYYKHMKKVEEMRQPHDIEEYYKEED